MFPMTQTAHKCSPSLSNMYDYSAVVRFEEATRCCSGECPKEFQFLQVGCSGRCLPRSLKRDSLTVIILLNHLLTFIVVVFCLFFFSLFSSPSGSLVKTRQSQLLKTVMVFYFVCFICKNDKYMLFVSVVLLLFLKCIFQPADGLLHS